jgi:osmoprotectant transport system permease protein
VDVWNFIVDHSSEFWSNGATHARLVATALLLAVPVAVAVGVLASSRPRLAGAALAVAGVIITIPSFALFGALIAPLGLGFRPAVATLALYSLLPVLRNTIVGLAEVPADVVEAARGMGMTGRQALWRVSMPLALPVIIAGVRVATVMIVGITTIAALITAGGLGTFIFDGLRSGDRTEIVAGTVTIVALALAFDGSLALIQHFLRRHAPRETAGALGPTASAAAASRA